MKPRMTWNAWYQRWFAQIEVWNKVVPDFALEFAKQLNRLNKESKK